jgi:hypothetical protein
VGAARRGTGPEAARGDGIVHPWAIRRGAARHFRAVMARGGGRSAAAASRTGVFRVVWGAAHYEAVRVVAARRRVGPEAVGARVIVHPWAVRRRAARRSRAVMAREVGEPAAASGRGAGASRILRAAAARPIRAVAARSGVGLGATRLQWTVAACAMLWRRGVRASRAVIARGGVGPGVASRRFRRPAARLRPAAVAWRPLRRPAARHRPAAVAWRPLRRPAARHRPAAVVAGGGPRALLARKCPRPAATGFARTRAPWCVLGRAPCRSPRRCALRNVVGRRDIRTAVVLPLRRAWSGRRGIG